MLMLLRPALALDVGEISAFMPGDSARLSKEIKNTTDSGRLVTIKIERISSPLASGTVIPMSSRDEMLLSPASLILPANASDAILRQAKRQDIVMNRCTKREYMRLFV